MHQQVRAQKVAEVVDDPAAEKASRIVSQNKDFLGEMDSYLKDLGKWKQTRFTGEAQDSEAPGSLEAEDFSTS